MRRMSRTTQPTTSLTDELWVEYQSLQLSAEAKAVAHQRAEELTERAERDGVYERARAAAGTVEWSMSWQELRSEE